jgi:hypothetical protein
MSRRRLTERDRLLRGVKESEWTRRVVQMAKTAGWLVHHSRPAINQRGRWLTALSGTPGLPDLVMVKPPRVIFAELKRQNLAVFTDDQRRWLDALRACYGIEVYVWRPSDVVEVGETLGLLAA